MRIVPLRQGGWKHHLAEELGYCLVTSWMFTSAVNILASYTRNGAFVDVVALMWARAFLTEIFSGHSYGAFLEARYQCGPPAASRFPCR
jgi:hypothetical protein